MAVTVRADAASYDPEQVRLMVERAIEKAKPYVISAAMAGAVCATCGQPATRPYQLTERVPCPPDGNPAWEYFTVKGKQYGCDLHQPQGCNEAQHDEPIPNRASGCKNILRMHRRLIVVMQATALARRMEDRLHHYGDDTFAQELDQFQNDTLGI